MILTRPRFYNQRCCIRIFDTTITGAVQTSGSENITIVERISDLIFGVTLLIIISKRFQFSRDFNLYRGPLNCRRVTTLYWLRDRDPKDEYQQLMQGSYWSIFAI